MIDTETPGDQYVVLADVVGSRDVRDRESFEQRLHDALDYVNEANSRAVATPFTQMKGVDEFGGVVTSAVPIPRLVCDIHNHIHPARARFAVTSGRIDIGTEYETVARMDGPAFHRSNELLREVEGDELYVGVDTGRAADPLLSGALNALLFDRERITERQAEIILAYEKHDTQTEAAEQLGIRQQAVSDSLRRSNYVRREQVRERLRPAIEEIYG